MVMVFIGCPAWNNDPHRLSANFASMVMARSGVCARLPRHTDFAKVLDGCQACKPRPPAVSPAKGDPEPTTRPVSAARETREKTSTVRVMVE